MPYTHNTIGNDMELTINTQLTIDELRATIKSLSIGCDQVAKKVGRVSSTKWQDGVSEEYALLMTSKHKLELALIQFMKETNHEQIYNT
jgi:hypothetical protein